MDATPKARNDSSPQCEVLPIAGALGAEIRGVDLKALDERAFAQIYRCLLDHLLILIRGQALTPADIVSLVRRFGTPVTSSNKLVTVQQ